MTFRITSLLEGKKGEKVWFGKYADFVYSYVNPVAAEKFRIIFVVLRNHPMELF
jgi:hypothetical protein